MRIGPIEIGRVRAAQSSAPRAGRELGASGVINLQGFLQQLEYSTELSGTKGLANLERMRSSDGAVTETLGHLVAPIRNANWDIEPASEQEDDLVVAEACRQALFEWPTQPFAEYLDQALDYLVFGHMLFETVWQVVDSPLTVDRPDAEPLEIPDRQYLTFRRFAQRLPSTIVKWNVADGELASVEQSVFKDATFSQIELPASELVVYVNQRRGDDFTGRTLLRGAYKHWVMKELIEKIEVVALERHGVGVWVGYPSAAYANDDAVLARMEDMLENIRAGARTYLVAPGPKAQSSAAAQDGFLFEVVSPGGQMPDFSKAKEYHRGEIKGSCLVRFAELGHASVGARATGDVQSEVWRDSLHAIARHIGEVNDEPLRRFCDANFSGVRRYPKLVAREIESKNLEEFANAHFRLVTAGAIAADSSYRRYVREVLGAPAEDDPEAAGAEREASTPTPPDEFEIEEE